MKTLLRTPSKMVPGAACAPLGLVSLIVIGFSFVPLP